MNIFKALSLGNGRISETNITSFLSALLNDSDAGSSFLLLLLSVLDALSENRISGSLQLHGATIREKLNDYRSRYTHLAIPEFLIQTQNGNRIVDVFLTIRTNDENDAIYFLFENKINRGAINQFQCLEQYQYFQSTEDYIEGIPIFNILLSSDDDFFEPMYLNVRNVNSNSIWLKWTNRDLHGVSVEKIIRDMIVNEASASISPIDVSLVMILKSFIEYIASELYYRETRNAFSVAGLEIIDSAEVNLNGELFSVIRYERNYIRVYNSNGDSIEPIKPKLREINNYYNLNVSLIKPNGRLKNTQQLGRDILNALQH